MQIEEIREDHSTVPKIRVEAATPTTKRNMIKNHPVDQTIRSKEKGVMTRSRINKELCLISQVEPKNAYEVVKDDY